MSEPMTEAEQAAREVIWHRLDGHEWAKSNYDGVAREVVDELRPIIAAEALREEAAALEEALVASAEPTLFVVPAHLWLRDRAALRTTTSEETR